MLFTAVMRSLRGVLEAARSNECGSRIVNHCVMPPKTLRRSLSDDRWEILRRLFPRPKPGGRPRAHQSAPTFEPLLRTQGQHLALTPHDFSLPTSGPPTTTFRDVGIDGNGKDPRHLTRSCLLGKSPHPKPSSTPKTARRQPKGSARSYGGGKKISRAKAAFARPHGSLGDRDGSPAATDRGGGQASCLKMATGYRMEGRPTGANGKIGEWIKRAAGMGSWDQAPQMGEVPTQRASTVPRGLHRLCRRRWCRTTWIMRNRRMSRAEVLVTEALVYVAMIG